MALWADFFASELLPVVVVVVGGWLWLAMAGWLAG
jgi:hypothetical protein